MAQGKSERLKEVNAQKEGRTESYRRTKEESSLRFPTGCLLTQRLEGTQTLLQPSGVTALSAKRYCILKIPF